MKPRACICVLFGLPGSGKTTLASNLTSFFSEKDCVVKCVSFDELVPLEKQAQIANSSSSDNFGETRSFRASMKELVESFLLSNESSAIRVVIVDDNNYYRSMRYEYYQLAAKHVVGYLQLFLQCSPEVAEINNKLRPAHLRVPERVIRDMNSKLQLPDEKWENCLMLNAQGPLETRSTFDLIWSRVKESIENPVTFLMAIEEKKAQADRSRELEERSAPRKIDTALRKCVGMLMSHQSTGTEKSELARQLNAVRISILEEVKSGALPLPDGEPIEDWIASVFLARASKPNISS